MIYDRKRNEIVYPVKTVVSAGQVRDHENLFIRKELIVTFNETRLTTLEKRDETPTWLILDFGKELHGGVRLVTPYVEKTTAKLRLVFGESVSEAMSSIGEKGATNDHAPRDVEVLVSNFSTLEFGQTGFRFVKIELLDTDNAVSFKNIVAVCRLADYPQLGSIQTSDKRLNEILNTAIYTCYLNMQDGVIWDGIKRDRLVWSGDLNTEILTLGYTFGTSIPHMKNSLDILRKTTPEGVWMNHIPTYSAWWVINLLDYYWLSGDLAYVKENLDYTNYILQELNACIDADGHMDFGKTGKPKGMEFFLDWPSYCTPDAVVGTAMLITYMAQKVKKIAFADMDIATAEEIEKKLSVYKDQEVMLKQTKAMQVVCGGGKDAKAFLEQNGASGFTTFMSYFLLRAMEERGSRCALNSAKTYYGGMLDRGATTFWEDFDMAWLDGSGRIDAIPKASEKDLHGDYGAFCYKGLRHSLCHGWSSGIVAFAYEKLVGLEIVEAGYKKIRIRPNLMGLTELSVQIPTPQGIIKIAVEGNQVRVETPEGVLVEE
ncbi:MAG: alpha-L-rhamnosidase [Clostridia bacterium]|nr:alpha-L-rhamnosidase [Clostridia bacterium]